MSMDASLFRTSTFIQSDEISIQLFQDRLLELAHHLKLPELVLNDFNVCSLALDEDRWIHISYSAKDSQIHWTSAMINVAFKDTRSFLSTLLAVNLDWELTQGGFFALDEITEVVFYRFHEPISNLHTRRFLEVTERFIERADFWRKRLQRKMDQLPDVYVDMLAPGATFHEGKNIYAS